MTAAAGWYPDASGTPRWWDGVQWVDVAPTVGPTSPPQVPAGTSSHTTWIWLVVLLPLLTLVPMIGYLDHLQRSMVDLVASIPTDGSPPNPELIVGAPLDLIFTPWYLVALVVGWVTSALCIWSAYLDTRVLAERGFVRPFAWWWMFISPLAYVIGRHVVVRRRGGSGPAPLIVTVVIQVAVFALVMVWAFVWSGQLVATILEKVAA